MDTVTSKRSTSDVARCPGPTPRDVIQADVNRAPAVVTEESYRYLGDEDVPFERYTSQEFFNLELDKMWRRTWQWTCRLEHIPEEGDYYVYDIGPCSILIVRTGEKPLDIKAYVNSCLHRGTKLKPSGSWGSCSHLRCPYHGWTWNLDGSLNRVPGRWDFPKVKDEEYALPQAKVGVWGGFVFINMDSQCMPLEEYLEVLPRHFKSWPLERRCVALHIEKTLPANWKAAQEAFLEAYHGEETHPQILKYTAGNNAQYDILGDRVSRFVHNFAVPDPCVEEKLTEQDILDATGMVPEGTVLPDGMTARSFIAQGARDAAMRDFGADVSRYSDAEAIDGIQYHLFPNMFFFPGVTLPMVYRFRPNGTDPDSSIFDLLFMRILGADEEMPDPPEVHQLAEDESYSSVPGVDDFFGLIYDQDTANLRMQQEGFKTAIKTGQTLGNFQEARIRHIHQTLDSYLND